MSPFGSNFHHDSFEWIGPPRKPWHPPTSFNYRSNTNIKIDFSGIGRGMQQAAKWGFFSNLVSNVAGLGAAWMLSKGNNLGATMFNMGGSIFNGFGGGGYNTYGGGGGFLVDPPYTYVIPHNGIGNGDGKKVEGDGNGDDGNVKGKDNGDDGNVKGKDNGDDGNVKGKDNGDDGNDKDKGQKFYDVIKDGKVTAVATNNGPGVEHKTIKGEITLGAPYSEQEGADARKQDTKTSYPNSFTITDTSINKNGGNKYVFEFVGLKTIDGEEKPIYKVKDETASSDDTKSGQSNSTFYFKQANEYTLESFEGGQVKLKVVGEFGATFTKRSPTST